MLTCNAYLKKNNGEISADRAEAKTEDCGSGVFAVFANGLSDLPLDAEHGMGIQIGLDGEINGYMAHNKEIVLAEPGLYAYVKDRKLVRR